jgi:short subunit dehydrogenase-like uncharacterized protein
LQSESGRQMQARRDKRDAELDVVVYGATSYVGRLVCEHLTAHYGRSGGLRWAVAGRSRDRLEALRESLGDHSGAIPVIVADAAEDGALAAMCERTRVVLSTVGPYALYGEPLVRACVDGGVDYCDLTGEVQWIRRMISRYTEPAASSGARLVHCCGFDSIPSDLGVWFLQQQLHARSGEYADRVRMRVERARGGVSGGTVASLLNVAEEAASDPTLRRELEDPYSLCPADSAPRVAQPALRSARFDPDFGAWTAPFFMAAINTRVVLRSNALAGYPYGTGFQYDEAMLTGQGAAGHVAALGIAAATGGFVLGATVGPTRALLKRLLPKPGHGPSQSARERGHYAIRFLGLTASGGTMMARVTGDRDPGYGSTARMFAEAGVCLAHDLARDDGPGGFWTPATLFGDRLVDRLRRRAGMTFDVVG